MSLILPKSYNINKRVQTLVENRTTYTVQRSEMHVFETSTEIEQVDLSFNSPILASMIEGQKIMHINDCDEFKFFPGESLMMPANEKMVIDFPNATQERPTQCSALTIDQDMFQNMIDKINENRTKDNLKEYNFNWKSLHFTNSIPFQQIMNRMLFLFMENHPSKDFFIELTIQELITRLIQFKNLNQLNHETPNPEYDERLQAVVDYISQNITKNIDVDELSKIACLSTSHFYKFFKNELGMSPVEFINQKRIQKAKSLIHAYPDKMLKEIYYECGFNNYSHFFNMFKQILNMTPQEYKKKLNMNGLSH